MFFLYCVLQCKCVCVFQEAEACKPLGVSLHAVSNGSAPPPAVLPAAAVLPAYGALPLMPGFLGAPHPAAATASAVTHTPTAATDWNTYYYVSRANTRRNANTSVVSSTTRVHLLLCLIPLCQLLTSLHFI